MIVVLALYKHVCIPPRLFRFCGLHGRGESRTLFRRSTEVNLFFLLFLICALVLRFRSTTNAVRNHAFRLEKKKEKERGKKKSAY